MWKECELIVKNDSEEFGLEMDALHWPLNNADESLTQARRRPLRR